MEVQETSVEKRELSSLIKAISVAPAEQPTRPGCSRALQASECSLLTGQATLGRKLNIVIDFNCSLHFTTPDSQPIVLKESLFSRENLRCVWPSETTKVVCILKSQSRTNDFCK